MSEKTEAVTVDFLPLCAALNAAIVQPLLRDENREDTLRNFGTLGLDILTRWAAEFQKHENPATNYATDGALEALRESLNS